MERNHLFLSMKPLKRFDCWEELNDAIKLLHSLLAFLNSFRKLSGIIETALSALLFMSFRSDAWRRDSVLLARAIDRK